MCTAFSPIEVPVQAINLSAFNYGDLIHWDRKREVLDKWGESEIEKQRQRFCLVEAATSIALVCIGFSEVVRRAISLQ